MLIQNPKAFIRGLILLISFLGIFLLFFIEVFPSHEKGKKVTGLVYADHLFNTLSKGSSNFFDDTAQKPNSVEFLIQAAQNKHIDVEVPYKENQAAAKNLVLQLGTVSGIDMQPTAQGIQIKGALYPFLKKIIHDSLAMYNNNGEALAARYQMPAAEAQSIMKAWWQLGSNMIKPLQRQEKIAEANAVNSVLCKAIEPSYNFYGIEPLQVRDNISLVVGFLIFYVVYTMWYGFAIFELFEGVGLAMTKSVKQEV